MHFHLIECKEFILNLCFNKIDDSSHSEYFCFHFGKDSISQLMEMLFA